MRTPTVHLNGRGYPVAVTSQQLSEAVVRALGRVAGRDDVELRGALPDSAEVSRARRPGHGDFTTNLPLRLGLAGRRRLQVAERLAAELDRCPGIASARVSGPGFLNITLAAEGRAGVLAEVLAAGTAFGRSAVDPRLASTVGRWPGEPAQPELASDLNPAYLVQRAHARASALLRNAEDLGVPSAAPAELDPRLLDGEPERELVLLLAELPGVVATGAQKREPQRLARHLEATAEAFHRFNESRPALPQGEVEPTPVHGARLLLVAATRIVLGNGLRLLGMTAPERM